MNLRISRSLRRAAFCACFSLLAALLISPACVAKPPAPSGSLGTPTLVPGSATQTTIDITFIAGAGGAPAGFTLQWTTEAAFIAAGNKWPDISCDASFSGNASGGAFSLANAGDSITLTVPTFAAQQGVPGFSEQSGCNTPLVCGTTYVFRAFSHNVPQGLNKSDFSAVVFATTLPCSSGCTLTQGYWKTHGPEPVGHNTNAWLLTSVQLGTVVYTDVEALAILNYSVVGNGLISLAHQLIAAKLSIANGAVPPPDIAADIAAADALIGSLVVPPIGTDSLDPSVTGDLTDALDAWLNANDCTNQ
jgi:hypothetical protein